MDSVWSNKTSPVSSLETGGKKGRSSNSPHSSPSPKPCQSFKGEYNFNKKSGNKFGNKKSNKHGDKKKSGKYSHFSNQKQQQKTPAEMPWESLGRVVSSSESRESFSSASGTTRELTSPEIDHERTVHVHGNENFFGGAHQQTHGHWNSHQQQQSSVVGLANQNIITARNSPAVGTTFTDALNARPNWKPLSHSDLIAARTQTARVQAEAARRDLLTLELGGKRASPAVTVHDKVDKYDKYTPAVNTHDKYNSMRDSITSNRSMGSRTVLHDPFGATISRKMLSAPEFVPRTQTTTKQTEQTMQYKSVAKELVPGSIPEGRSKHVLETVDAGAPRDVIFGGPTGKYVDTQEWWTSGLRDYEEAKEKAKAFGGAEHDAILLLVLKRMAGFRGITVW